MPFVVSLAGILLLAVAAVYETLTFIAVLIWQLRRPLAASHKERPAVSVLKPLCGVEPELYENLRSFCTQEYPSYQVVFGVQDAADPAIAIAQRVAREFPALPIEIVVDDSIHGSNRKVSNLINMMQRARHDVLIISDSDTRVGRDYLRTVCAPLVDRRIGMVACLYRCVPVAGIWSRLGAMYINDWYMPSVLLAWLFGHRSYVSGQTMGLRRETLEALGGLRAVANQLADDYELGERVRGLGLRLALSSYMPETIQETPDAAALINHETRWMRTIRALAPGGFRFLFVTFTLPLVAAGFALAAMEPRLEPLALWLLGVALVCRAGISCVPRLAQRRIPLGDLCLLPVRDLLLFCVWSCAIFTSHIVWRGSKFEVGAGGVMRGSA